MVAGGGLLDPAPLRVVDHRALARREHPAGARVDHHQARGADVAAEAPARALDRPVGFEGRTRAAPGRRRRSGARTTAARARPRPARAGRGCPGAGRSSRWRSRRRCARPTTPWARMSSHPLQRRVPVVVDVVVVEDHRRRHGGEQPAHERLAPGLAVEVGVLLEVGHRLVGRQLGVASPADVLERRRGDLVGVDLVAEQDQRVRPLLRRLVLHLHRQRPQRVDLAAGVVLLLGQRVRLLVRHAHAAGAEHDLDRPAGVVGADDRRREVAVGLRPHLLAVQVDLVGDRAGRARGPRGAPARSGGPRRAKVSALRPRTSTVQAASVSTQIGRLRLPGVAQQRAEDERGHRTGF